MLKFKNGFVYDKDDGAGSGLPDEKPEDKQDVEYLDSDEPRADDNDDDINLGLDAEQEIDDDQKLTSIEPEPEPDPEKTTNLDDKEKAWQEKEAKMQEDYKRIEYERNKFKNLIVKTNEHLKTGKKIQFDDNFDIIEVQEIQDNKVSTVDKIEQEILDVNNAIDEIDKKFDDDEISNIEHTKKVASLINKRGILEYKKENEIRIANDAIQAQESQKTAQMTELNKKYLGILNEEFKDHNTTSSDLFKEMVKLNMANPSLYGNPDVNCKDRLLLAQRAAVSLNKNKSMLQKTKEKIITKHSSLTSSSYSKDSKNKLSDNKINYLARGGLDRSLINEVSESISKSMDDYKSGKTDGVYLDD